MSQGNVELVQRYIAAVSALVDRATESGGRMAAFDSPEAAAIFEQFWHPQAVRDSSRRPDGGIYHGPAGVRQSIRDWTVAWEDFDIDFKEFLAAGDRVVVVQDFRGIAEGGMEVEWHDFCSVFTIHDGQFTHHEEHWSRAEALEAVGLRD